MECKAWTRPIFSWFGCGTSRSAFGPACAASTRSRCGRSAMPSSWRVSSQRRVATLPTATPDLSRPTHSNHLEEREHEITHNRNGRRAGPGRLRLRICGNTDGPDRAERELPARTLERLDPDLELLRECS